jgi:hypothetical protein
VGPVERVVVERERLGQVERSAVAVDELDRIGVVDGRAVKERAQWWFPMAEVFERARANESRPLNSNP